MTTGQEISSADCAAFDFLQKFKLDDVRACFADLDLMTGQESPFVTEGRTTLDIEEGKSSTIHFGKLLEGYILTKYAKKIEELLSDDMEAFSVRERDLLDSRFLITRYNNELHVRSIVFGSSEQKTPRTHYERLGLRLFQIITHYIKENDVPSREPFSFIGKQFVFKYDGPEKKRIIIWEFTPRVVEVNPESACEDEPVSTVGKTTNSSSKVPRVIVTQLREIHRSKGRDIDLNKYKLYDRLWIRIQDIAYGSEYYDREVLKNLNHIIHSVLWTYDNPDRADLQEKWNDMIKMLNAL